MVSMKLCFLKLICTRRLSYPLGAQDLADKTPFGAAVKGNTMLFDFQDFDTYPFVQVRNLLLTTWQGLYQGPNLVLLHPVVPWRKGLQIMQAKVLSMVCLLLLMTDTSP